METKLTPEEIIKSNKEIKKIVINGKEYKCGTITPVGHWIRETVDPKGTTYKCSNCNITQTVTVYNGTPTFEYCPYCGAYMKERPHRECTYDVTLTCTYKKYSPTVINDALEFLRKFRDYFSDHIKSIIDIEDIDVATSYDAFSGRVLCVTCLRDLTKEKYEVLKQEVNKEGIMWVDNTYVLDLASQNMEVTINEK